MQLLEHGKGLTHFLEHIGGDSRRVTVIDASPPPTALVLELENELRITRELDARGIRRALERFERDGKVGLVSTYFGGETLVQTFRLTRQPLARCLAVAARIAEVLSHVHAGRVVHGRLHPGAIRVDPTFREVEIAEFGHAARFDIDRGVSRELLGGIHAPYAAPEQTGRTNRPVDWRADLYSLGAILFEMLTGEPPFAAGEALELVHRIIAVEARSVHEVSPAVPQAVAAIVRKLLAKDAEDRYQSAEGLRADLEHALAEFEKAGVVSDFPLARADATARFELPRKLYGREAELDRLLEAFDRSLTRGVEFVLVAGSSGVGKSALVHELARPLALRRGRLIEGKFDQYQRERPFSALSDAFARWVELVLSESDAELARTRDRVLDAATGLGGLLTELVPDLELILGPQPAPSEVTAAEAQNRFEYVLARFLRVLSDESRPLVLFIDDLQWADAASLDLLRSLVSDPEVRHLVVVGAFRDNEVEPGHPFALVLDQLDRANVATSRLSLGPLPDTAIAELVADALGERVEEVAPLARHVGMETGGNALFLVQLLRSLYDEGVLHFDAAAARWTWDLERSRTGEARDVLALLRAKATRIPEAARALLVTAACLGRVVDVRTLALVCGRSTTAVAADLEPAVREGLVGTRGEGHRYLASGMALTGDLEATFAFSHDRVQQAVYDLVAEGDRATTHLAIGRALLGEKLEGAALFEVVNQLHRGRGSITDASEKRRLAGLDLEAGLSAKRSAAYVAAHEYLEAGLECLPDPRGADRRMALALELEAAECAYLAGRIERMEAHASAALGLGEGILDTIRIFHLRVDAYTSQNRLNDALSVGLDALAQLGVRFPRSPQLPHIFAGLGRTKFALAGKDVPALAHQRSMTDPKMLEAMLLLERLVPPAYMSGSMLFPLFVFTMVDLSVRHGNSPLSAFGYASFAITLSGVLGDIRSGETFGKLGLETLEVMKAEAYRVKVYFVLYVFISHWTRPLHEAAPLLLDAYRSGMRAGNLVGSTWSAYYRLLWNYFTGRPIDDLEREAATYSSVFRDLEQHAAHRRTDMLRQVLINLSGRSADPIVFGGETYRDAEIETLTQLGDDATSRFFYHYNKLVLGYLFGRDDLALEHGDRAKELLESVTGLPDTPFYAFYDALMRIRSSEGASGLRRFRLLARARAHKKNLAKWGGFGVANYQHKHDLVAAELARVERDDAAARVFYERAVEGAERHDFPQEAALAAELAAHFYAKQGASSMAAFLLRRAHDGYLRWGARAKAEALEMAHPEVASASSNSVAADSSPGSTDIGTLDVASVIKAATAISGDIVLERLVASILAILVENTGAQRGVLVLVEDGRMRAVAKKFAHEERARLLTDGPLGGVTPEGVLQYVARSKRVVVLADATTDARFSRDPFVVERVVRSVLAVPVVNQGELRALVYLENNLSPGVFSKERVGIVNALGGQIAISLENARLYGNLEQALARQVALTDAYGRFTPRAFLDFLGKESILDVHLGDQIHGEMTVLFLDIRGYTTLSESMTPAENFRFINGFLRRIAPAIGREGGVVNTFLGDGLMAFFRTPVAALRAAVAMQEAVRDYSTERVAKGRSPLRVGIGLHEGPLMIGIIGDAERMDTALVSDTVNTAARMEGLTKEFHASTIASEGTVLHAIEQGFVPRYRPIGDVQVKGKSKPLRVVECFDSDPDEVASRKERWRVEFGAALDVFRAGRFDEAERAFAAIVAKSPGDGAATRYAERSGLYARRGAPEGWAGVEVMERK